MNKEEDILARILEIIMYSLMLWIFVSGSLTNDLSLLQPLFFFLTTYLFVDYSGKLRKAKVNRGGKILCALLLFALSLGYYFLFGYFQLTLVHL